MGSKENYLLFSAFRDIAEGFSHLPMPYTPYRSALPVDENARQRKPNTNTSINSNLFCSRLIYYAYVGFFLLFFVLFNFFMLESVSLYFS